MLWKILNELSDQKNINTHTHTHTHTYTHIFMPIIYTDTHEENMYTYGKKDIEVDIGKGNITVFKMMIPSLCN